MLEFHHLGNADVRPDERSFAYIIFHYTKGAGRLAPDAPDRALKLLRRMIGMYRQGYKDLMPSHQNRTNPIFSFTSVIDAHSVLRRNDSGIVGAELFESMTKLGEKIESLRPNTYACMSVLYGWSSCGSVDSGERATELLQLIIIKNYSESSGILRNYFWNYSDPFLELFLELFGSFLECRPFFFVRYIEWY